MIQASHIFDNVCNAKLFKFSVCFLLTILFISIQIFSLFSFNNSLYLEKFWYFNTLRTGDADLRF